MRKFVICIALSGAFLMSVTPARTQLPGNKYVAAEFLSWDVAWSKLTPAQQRDLGWLRRAAREPWSASDAPFVAARREVDAQVRVRGFEAVYAERRARVTASSPPAERFALAHLAHSETPSTRGARNVIAQRRETQALLRAQYVPSFEYTRMLFLLEEAPPKLLESVGDRLLKQSPRDVSLLRSMVSLLGSG